MRTCWRRPAGFWWKPPCRRPRSRGRGSPSAARRGPRWPCCGPDRWPGWPWPRCWRSGSAAPTLAGLGLGERWVSRSPQTRLETFGWFRGEGFGLIVEDLLRVPAGPGVIAEGFRLLPRLVRPLLAGPRHAVWLCPPQGFRRAAFASRGSLLQIAGKTSDPDTALANLLERDGMFTDRLREEATGLGLPVIDVDTTMTEDELTGRVARTFGLS